MDVAQDKFLKFDGTTRVTKKGQATGPTNGKLVQNYFSFICNFDRFPTVDLFLKTATRFRILMENLFLNQEILVLGFLLPKMVERQSPWVLHLRTKTAEILLLYVG